MIYQLIIYGNYQFYLLKYYFVIAEASFDNLCLYPNIFSSYINNYIINHSNDSMKGKSILTQDLLGLNLSVLLCYNFYLSTNDQLDYMQCFFAFCHILLFRTFVYFDFQRSLKYYLMISLFCVMEICFNYPSLYEYLYR